MVGRPCAIGDYKDGYACVRMANKMYKHIDRNGKNLNEIIFDDLGVFHKSFATAKDKTGWFHINIEGKELYKERYSQIEPFYNGFAIVEDLYNNKLIINENGICKLVI